VSPPILGNLGESIRRHFLQGCFNDFAEGALNRKVPQSASEINVAFRCRANVAAARGSRRAWRVLLIAIARAIGRLHENGRRRGQTRGLLFFSWLGDRENLTAPGRRLVRAVDRDWAAGSHANRNASVTLTSLATIC
jgi:hypothetical protein